MSFWMCGGSKHWSGFKNVPTSSGPPDTSNPSTTWFSLALSRSLLASFELSNLAANSLSIRSSAPSFSSGDFLKGPLCQTLPKWASGPFWVHRILSDSLRLHPYWDNDWSQLFGGSLCSSAVCHIIYFPFCFGTISDVKCHKGAMRVILPSEERSYESIRQQIVLCKLRKQ